MQTIYEASILLVDDNPDLLVLVGDSLRTAGYTCIRTAATCAEARALFAAAAPELMILDINLPDGDGFTLLRQLHAKADVPHCSSRLGTLTLTACWGWALARTTT